MSIPVSWLSAVLPHSLPAVQATAKSLVNSTAQVFGALLPSSTPPANGPSAGLSTRTSSTVDNSLARDQNPGPDRGLLSRLSQLIANLKQQFGWTGSNEPVQVVADGVGIPEIQGPELLQKKAQEVLNQDPDLVAEINALARQQLDSDPLRWMPGNSATVRWTIPSRD